MRAYDGQNRRADCQNRREYRKAQMLCGLQTNCPSDIRRCVGAHTLHAA